MNQSTARRYINRVLLALALLASGPLPAAPVRADSGISPVAPGRAFADLPLSFERNLGQTDASVRFVARADGQIVYLTQDEAVLVLDAPSTAGTRPVLRLSLAGADRSAPLQGLRPTGGRSNYFRGTEPSQWQRGIPQFARVRQAGIYPGIDLLYHGDKRRLEYDFVLAPAAAPERIRLGIAGADTVAIATNGDLELNAAGRSVRQLRPVAYQLLDGRRVEVRVDYVLHRDGLVGFALGDYDRSQALVIDPVLLYSTYLGGTGFDQGYAVALDGTGAAYVTGKTAALDFPTTPGSAQTVYGGDDAFVAKIDPSGSALVWSSYLNSARGNGIAVDKAGNVYVTGEASTLAFPTTPGAFHTSPMGFDAFVTKFRADGSALLYSARFGGDFDDFPRAIALDGAGNAYITGWTVCLAPTCSFPVVNAFQPAYGGGYNDAFVSKLNAAGSALVYSTYLGGGAIINATEDWGQAIAVDAAGSAYVAGYTYSPDFPVTAGAYDTSRYGLDAFVTKFSPDGRTLAYSTFLGGTMRDQAQGIAVDAAGSAYVTGWTESWDDPATPANEGFPVTPGAFQPRGSFDAFVSKLNPQGSALLYSTYLGGAQDEDRGWAIALDGNGNAYVTGDTHSADFPVAGGPQPNYGGSGDAFAARLNATGTALVYSTFLGGALADEGRGIAVNASGEAVIVGSSSSANFPTSHALQPANAGGLENHDDAVVVKLSATAAPPDAPALVSLTLSPASLTGGASSQGTVLLSAAPQTQPVVVALASGQASIARVPSTVSVPTGSTSAKFSISTSPVATSSFVTISASYLGVQKSAVLSVFPAAVDTVTITSASYRSLKKQLVIAAASTSASATLTAYVTSSGQLIGTLSNLGGGKYSGQFAWPTNPGSVTVRSSQGGSASRAVR